MSVRLSHGQAEILCLVCKGHNFLVTGQEGNWHIYFGKGNHKEFSSGWRKVFVVCSSGIACTILVPPPPCIPIMDEEIADPLRGELSDWLIGTID